MSLWHGVNGGLYIMCSDAVQFTLQILQRHTTTVYCSNGRSVHLQPVGKKKYDPNAVTTNTVMASVGTGCGGFQGYFSLIIIPGLSFCLSTKNKTKKNRKDSTPNDEENK